MTTLANLCRNVLRLSGVSVLLVVPSFATGLSASATYTAVADPNVAGVYNYTFNLNDTGTTTIGTFWFAWIPGGDFLSPKPTNVIQPFGWTNSLVNNATNTGTSIRWITTTSLLQPGQSLSGFGFSSTETPDQLLGNVLSGTGAGRPILTSFVYIGAAFADPGTTIVPTATTPEPSSFALLVTGLIGGAGACYRRFKIVRTDS